MGFSADPLNHFTVAYNARVPTDHIHVSKLDVDTSQCLAYALSSLAYMFCYQFLASE